MDPVTLLATLNATFNGVKKLVAVGREAQDVMKQLGKWADAASQLHGYINKHENRKPGIFEKIGFKGSEGSEALDIMAAKQRLKSMEDDIYNMFLYGELQDLGLAGYREFVQLRKRIREDRQKALRDQARRRLKFIENTFAGIIISTLLAVSIYFSVIIFELGRNAGKW
jgi:hypothetical protein